MTSRLVPPSSAALALFVSMLVVGAASPVCAQIVGVSFDESGSRLGRRLSAELRSRGYDTRDLASGAATTSLGDLDAVVWAHDDPALVRVCVAAATGRAPSCESLTDPDESVLLIRAVELVRAHLGEPGPPVRDVAPPEPGAEPAATPAPPTERWDLGILATFLPPTGGFSIGAGATVVLQWAPDPLASFELGGLVALLDPVVEDAAGSASASPRMAWLGVDLRVPEALLEGHRLSFGVAAACSGAELHTRASPTFEARQASFVALTLMARASFVVRIVDGIGLAIGVRAGAALPQPVLVFDTREVARWGAPFVSIDLGLMFRL